ncbi:hypothetical protein T4D_7930 [Trichinella pseudospiralis]|uniref:Uncharacterized protein n=1 Tax=Trichinella pseudospiralis TaxID=6337 RepID=A0A0V1G108_TRIPS|nr:hypothetical protein T4D_7930 [Trichinella pseudospiralis]
MLPSGTEKSGCSKVIVMRQHLCQRSLRKKHQSTRDYKTDRLLYDGKPNSLYFLWPNEWTSADKQCWLFFWIPTTVNRMKNDPTIWPANGECLFFSYTWQNAVHLKHDQQLTRDSEDEDEKEEEEDNDADDDDDDDDDDDKNQKEEIGEEEEEEEDGGGGGGEEEKEEEKEEE